jgi:hypothetical protein
VRQDVIDAQVRSGPTWPHHDRSSPEDTRANVGRSVSATTSMAAAWISRAAASTKQRIQPETAPTPIDPLISLMKLV